MLVAEIYIFYLVANYGQDVIGTTKTLEQCVALLRKTEKELAEDKLEIPVMKCSTGFPERKFKNIDSSEVENAVKTQQVRESV